jgi:hypothetical protein
VAKTGDSFVVDIRPFAAGREPVEGFLEVFKYAVEVRGSQAGPAVGGVRGFDAYLELDDEPFYQYNRDPTFTTRAH